MTAAELASDFSARRKLNGARLGKYTVGTRLGAGGTASVYLGRSVGNDGNEQLLALKVVHDHLSDEKEFIAQFLDEANIATRLSHPNVVRVHELCREETTLFLAMEYLDGQPLSQICDKLVEKRQRLPPAVVAWLGAGIARGLHYAHELRDEGGDRVGLVHRDVSPQNIFITYDGRVLLIDFGIARAAGRLARTTLGKLKGKFSYMAPEQLLGSKFDHRADIFALGATLYEAAAGSRLFGGDDRTETLHKVLFEEVPPLSKQLPGFPNSLSEILQKALANEVSDRYSTAEQLAQDLEGYLATQGGDPRAWTMALLEQLFVTEREQQRQAIERLRHADLGVDSWDGRASRATLRALPEPPAPRRRWRLALGVLGMSAALSAGALLLWSRKQPEPPPGALAPPAVASVTIDVKLQPDPGDAVVKVNGKVVSARPPKVTLAKSGEPVEVEVSAPGFETWRVRSSAERDQVMVATLARASTAGSAAPGASSAPRHVPGGPKPKQTGSLVTDYPF